MRNLVYSKEYLEFEQKVNARTKEKLQYAASILQTVTPISTQFVKKLVSSDFYELRIKVDNEIRVILFSADDPNINLATKVVLLNGFVKKSNKDYKREITIATNILRRIINEGDEQTDK